MRSVLSMKIIAKMIEVVGITKIITMDIHSLEIQDFFDIPVENLSSVPAFVEAIKNEISDWTNIVIVSPDLGSAKRCASIADKLDLSVVLIHKGKYTNYRADCSLILRAQ